MGTTLPRRRTATAVGGARRDRTDDLLLAKQALSQLSYGPGGGQVSGKHLPILIPDPRPLDLVGLGRLELPTSRLSGVRSNQTELQAQLSRESRRSQKQP
jgi:hypothetical protein